MMRFRKFDIYIIGSMILISLGLAAVITLKHLNTLWAL